MPNGTMTSMPPASYYFPNSLQQKVSPRNLDELRQVHSDASPTAYVYVTTIASLYMVGLVIIIVHYMNSSYGKWRWTLTDVWEEFRPFKCTGDKRSEEDADASNEDEEKQRMSPEHKLMSSTRRTAVDKEEEHDSGHGSVSCRTTGDVSVEIQVHAHTVSTRSATRVCDEAVGRNAVVKCSPASVDHCVVNEVTDDQDVGNQKQVGHDGQTHSSPECRHGAVGERDKVCAGQTNAASLEDGHVEEV